LILNNKRRPDKRIKLEEFKRNYNKLKKKERKKKINKDIKRDV
jgi:hypothetical protein